MSWLHSSRCSSPACRASTASAKIIDRERYSDTFSGQFTACGGVNVRVDGQVDGRFKVRQHGSQLRAYVFDNYLANSRYTNLQTGRSWTSTSRSTHVDVQIRLVSGTTYKFTWQDAGTFKVFDQTGKLAYVQSGLRRETALVDTHGNLNLDDDDYLIQLSVKLTGHYPFSDFCVDLRKFTTG